MANGYFIEVEHFYKSNGGRHGRSSVQYFRDERKEEKLKEKCSQMVGISGKKEDRNSLTVRIIGDNREPQYFIVKEIGI